jgi:lipopolysaccharide/colanic/teichoic acid biosynthesis glycosyltransferase
MSITGIEGPGGLSEAGKPGFYRVFGKRAADIFFSAVGMLLFSPLFLLLSVLIKLTSKGPVLYRQGRVGLNGSIFHILKFRSMRVGADSVGPALTCAGDRRITPIGRWLRRFKLDELPQLWNVLVGDMSLVGPRPEHPVYVCGYNAEQRRVLTIRPGVTDSASILYRHEEDLLRSASDLESFYRQVVLPHKLSLNLSYVDNLSASRDLSLIVQTLASLVAARSARLRR